MRVKQSHMDARRRTGRGWRLRGLPNATMPATALTCGRREMEKKYAYRLMDAASFAKKVSQGTLPIPSRERHILRSAVYRRQWSRLPRSRRDIPLFERLENDDDRIAGARSPPQRWRLTARPSPACHSTSLSCPNLMPQAARCRASQAYALDASEDRGRPARTARRRLPSRSPLQAASRPHSRAYLISEAPRVRRLFTSCKRPVLKHRRRPWCLWRRTCSTSSGLPCSITTVHQGCILHSGSGERTGA
jgi:hypothetical protein